MAKEKFVGIQAEMEDRFVNEMTRYQKQLGDPR